MYNFQHFKNPFKYKSFLQNSSFLLLLIGAVFSYSSVTSVELNFNTYLQFMRKLLWENRKYSGNCLLRSLSLMFTVIQSKMTGLTTQAVNIMEEQIFLYRCRRFLSSINFCIFLRWLYRIVTLRFGLLLRCIFTYG